MNLLHPVFQWDQTCFEVMIVEAKLFLCGVPAIIPLIVALFLAYFCGSGCLVYRMSQGIDTYKRISEPIRLIQVSILILFLFLAG